MDLGASSAVASSSLGFDDGGAVWVTGAGDGLGGLLVSGANGPDLAAGRGRGGSWLVLLFGLG